MKYQLLMNTMIKSICSIAMLLISFSAVFSQAILPTAFNFSDATPEGWSESLGGSNTRYTNGFVGQACRLDQTSDYVLIEFAEEPGALTYYIKGQNQGATWQGSKGHSSGGECQLNEHRILARLLKTLDADEARIMQLLALNRVGGHCQPLTMDSLHKSHQISERLWQGDLLQVTHHILTIPLRVTII
jgi:hypothetical protein